MSVQRVIRFVPVLLITAFLLLLWWTYASGDVQGYYRLLRYTGMRPYFTPFLDTDTVLSAARCLHNGVDAYRVNPCDPLWRPYDYSPLFMGLSYLPVTPAWLVPLGIGLVVTFLLALLLLPLPSDREGVVVTTLATFSTVSLFALERGNNELLIFALGALGAWGLSRRRTWGYAAILLAGLLKYFPLLTMAVALRERPAKLFALAGASLLVVGGLLALTWGHFIQSLANYPGLSPYDETFGAINAAQGVARIFHWSNGTRIAIELAMIALSFIAAWRLASGAATAKALGSIGWTEQSFLLVGALLVIGCFFASRNIDYRGIHLLLTLPALLALRRAGAPGWIANAPLVVVLLMWSQFVRMYLTFTAKALGDPVGWYIDWWLGWFGRELVWWWMVTVLLALAGRLLWDGPLVGEVRARFTRAPA